MQFDRLIKIMEKLRGPDGCPWDKEQTRDSLKPFLLEEVYEVLEALDEDDPEKIKEELGDLLFQEKNRDSAHLFKTHLLVRPAFILFFFVVILSAFF